MICCKQTCDQKGGIACAKHTFNGAIQFHFGWHMTWEFHAKGITPAQVDMSQCCDKARGHAFAGNVLDWFWYGLNDHGFGYIFCVLGKSQFAILVAAIT